VLAVGTPHVVVQVTLPPEALIVRTGAGVEIIVGVHPVYLSPWPPPSRKVAAILFVVAADTFLYDALAVCPLGIGGKAKGCDAAGPIMLTGQFDDNSVADATTPAAPPPYVCGGRDLAPSDVK